MKLLGYLIRGTVILLISILFVSSPLMSYAISQNDLNSIINNRPWYNPSTCNTDPSEPLGAVSTVNLDYSRGGRAVGVTVFTPSGQGTYPLLMFSPGRSQSTKSGHYDAYLKAIAQQGFVVAGANYTDNTTYDAIANEVQDIKFLITTLQSEPQVSGRINQAAGVGMFGHSDGGLVSEAIGYDSQLADSRVKAVIPESGGIYQNASLQNGPPLLVAHGTSDSIAPISNSADLYQSASTSYKAFVQFVGSEHESLVVDNKYLPATEAITGAFFKRFLTNSGDTATKISSVVSQYSPLVTVQESGSDTPAGSGSGSTSSSTVVSPDVIKFLAAWAINESGGGGGDYNPVNFTGGTGTDFNSIHVKNYASYDDGIKYTVQFLKQPNMKDVTAGLVAGDASATAKAMNAFYASWGGDSNFGNKILASSSSVDVNGTIPSLHGTTLSKWATDVINALGGVSPTTQATGCVCSNNSGASTGGEGADIVAAMNELPAFWKEIIMGAAPKYPDVDPRLVAATLWIENRGWPDPNKQWSVSSSSAQGPWQFIPSTWATMGRDGDGDGIKDPNNPKDAVLAAFEHQRGSAGKPISAEYDGNPESSFHKVVYKKDTSNLLYFIGKYNGSGAPNGTKLDAFSRGQNSDYVIMGYWLLATNFKKTWNTTKWGTFIDVSGTAAAGADSSAAGGGAGCSSSSGAMVGNLAWPVNKKFWDDHPEWFTKPHHDHPAADIPVPMGTEVYSMTDGTVIKAPAGGDCGIGVIIDTADGVRMTYCHGSDGGNIVKTGDKVTAGQLIMHSASTGASTGPHLHVGISVGSVARCPQQEFEAMGKGAPIDLKTLPTSGCTNGSL